MSLRVNVRSLVVHQRRGEVVRVHDRATPPVIFRERLAVARRAGGGFDESWLYPALTAAVSTIRWEREEWREVLSSMFQTWRAAWERRDASSAERVLSVLPMPGGTPLPERACEQCGGEIPADHHRNARYCPDGCTKRVAYLRERQRAAAQGRVHRPRTLWSSPRCERRHGLCRPY